MKEAFVEVDPTGKYGRYEELLRLRRRSKRNKLLKSKMMSSTEPPPFSFSSLPNDIVLNVLARVPKRCYPILSCVSKKLRSLLGSTELHKMRTLLGKDDRLYVCFEKISYESRDTQWYTLTKNRRLVSVPFPFPPVPWSRNSLAVGPDIYFFGDDSRMWILDTLSGTLREGPPSLVATNLAAVGLVNEKIYVFAGKCLEKEFKDIQAQVFDLKTQTWQIAPNPTMDLPARFTSVVPSSLDGKIYAWTTGLVIAYDSKDGTCDIIIAEACREFYIGIYNSRNGQQMIVCDEFNDKYNMCVIDNVLYMQFPYVGLLWYDSKKREWNMVQGVKLDCYFRGQVKMVDYNGKLAFLWKRVNKSEVWCAVIALYVSKVAVRGRVEWSECLVSDVPHDYIMEHVIVSTN